MSIPVVPDVSVRPRHRFRGRRRLVVGACLAVALATLVAVGLPYRRQIVSYLTHWKGSPTNTSVYRDLRPAPQLHLAVAGDIGDSGDRLTATARAMARVDERDPFDALLLLGDNVYPSGDPARLPATVFEPFAPLLDRGVELLAILGNHDVMQGHGDEQMAALGMPGRWWAREIGDVLLVGLDSNEPDDPRQLRFLTRTLATSSARWKIVALHHPPYSAGYQGSSDAARHAFSPVFEQYGVQLVLSGHDHDYQRSKPIGGVTYVVSGAAAGTRRTGSASFTAESFSWHHFVDIAVYDDHLLLRAVNQDGRVADETVLRP
jgi:3',5'-cyclic AMP phosphodiesterase CpdA